MHGLETIIALNEKAALAELSGRSTAPTPSFYLDVPKEPEIIRPKGRKEDRQFYLALLAMASVVLVALYLRSVL